MTLTLVPSSLFLSLSLLFFLPRSLSVSRSFWLEKNAEAQRLEGRYELCKYRVYVHTHGRAAEVGTPNQRGRKRPGGHRVGEARAVAVSEIVELCGLMTPARPREREREREARTEEIRFNLTRGF